MALYATQTPFGGLIVGVCLSGRGFWLEREPICHRWRLIRSRIPNAVGRADDDAPPDIGVREPRRPRPGSDSAFAALDRPDPW
jgi:hypothetical protein